MQMLKEYPGDKTQTMWYNGDKHYASSHVLNVGELFPLFSRNRTMNGTYENPAQECLDYTHVRLV